MFRKFNKGAEGYADYKPKMYYISALALGTSLQTAGSVNESGTGESGISRRIGGACVRPSLLITETPFKKVGHTVQKGVGHTVSKSHLVKNASYNKR